MPHDRNAMRGSITPADGEGVAGSAESSHADLARGPSREDSVLTLRQCATGLLALADRSAVVEEEWVSPFPRALQRGLNRLALACLRRQRPPIGDLAALVVLAEQPLEVWPLDLPPDEYDLAATLLTPDGTGRPTRACEELALARGDMEAALREEGLMGQVLARCRATNAQDDYVAFRRLLIERPVLSHEELLEIVDRPEFLRLQNETLSAYPVIPPHYARDGAVRQCPHCGCATTPQRVIGGAVRWACVEMSCKGALQPAHDEACTRLAARNGVHWLRPDLRRYILAPGRPELTLAAELKALRLTVQLWPGVDRYDLRVMLPGAEIWAIDVKDWSNPVQLASYVQPIPPDPPWTSAFFVFPDARRDRYLEETGGDYRRVFVERCATLGKACEARYASEITRAARQLLRGTRRSAAPQGADHA